MPRSLFISLRILLFLLVAAFAQVSWAQDVPDFNAFRSFANSVETDLQEDRKSDEAFEELRAELADWRQRLLQAQGANSVQIEALTAQIQTLGPAPAEGESEPENIAARRADLQDQLARAREPRIAAEEAHARADALIGRIDTTLRARQTDELLELQGSPLIPELWGDALGRIASVWSDVREELSTNLATFLDGENLSRRVPVVLLLIIGALVLIARGPRWVERLIARIETRSGEQGRIVYGFLVSLGAIATPLIGITLLNVALISSGLLGQVSLGVSLGINIAIFAYAVSRWLGHRLFPERDFIPSPLVLNDRQRAEGRFLSLSMGGIIGYLLFVQVMDRIVEFNAEIVSVFSFPGFVLLGLALFRVGRLLLASGRKDNLTDGGPSFTNYVVRTLGRVVSAIAIAGPLVAAIGYFKMAETLLLPTAVSLALLALLTTLHFVIRAAYGLLRGLGEEQSGLALTPVLISFTLAVASIPLFALIWGARLTDLGELWTRFQAGIRLGDTTISPGAFLTFAIVFALGFLFTRLVQGTLRSSVLPRTKLDKGGQNAIVSGLGYLGITLAALIGITSAGIDLSNLAIIVGALGVGIGFGLQNIVNNFVSGIILLIERPIGEGDWVEVNGQMGIVRSISVRSTRIETFDRTDVIVPNGDLISGTVTNWTRGNSIGRVIVPVGVAYGTDTKKVEQILKDIAVAHPIVATHPPPQVFFMRFGADSLDFEIRAILKDVNFILNVHSDMNHEIARRFAEEGIEIPFAQRDVWLRNPEALQQRNNEPSAPRPPSGPADRALSEPDDGDAE
ncbi:MAG: DUF3772 domain-containing protein [Silicimonas sp.]